MKLAIRILIFVSFATIGCKKLISIQKPVGTLNTDQVFSTDEQAISASIGMYYKMINTTTPNPFNSLITILNSLSADDLTVFNQGNTNYVQFQKNQLTSKNPMVNTIWANAYSIIYTSNSIIEGLTNYSGVHDSVKNELIGEAEFVRAFCNFYLVNLFGDIPLVTTINYTKTDLLKRESQDQVYKAIVADLLDAQKRLPLDYSVGNGQRIIPNKWAATALLARVYLYSGDWLKAEDQATLVINNSGLYHLESNLNNVFLITSNEAIWQLQQNNSGAINSYNATPEGFLLLPRVLNSTFPPFAYLPAQLLNAFEPDDQRKVSWIVSSTYNGIEYKLPYKYKIGPGQSQINGPYTEYYMVLRLAEQYLIRAEARAQQNNIMGQSSASSDLNMIRNRAGLANTNASTKDDMLKAIFHERQAELFVEWGHRWLDLKRINNATNVLSAIKTQWMPSAQLYPIPYSELTVDPNMTQNDGY